MSTEYLEFNSNFRNRKLYPLPSEFVVEISQSGSKNNLTALDPVCESAPLEIWNPSVVFTSIGSEFTGYVLSHTPFTAGSTTTRTILTISIPQATVNLVSKTTNYYSGSVIEFNLGSGNFEYERILEWRYLYTNTTPNPDEDIFLVVLYSQVSVAAIQSNVVIKIKDSSDFTDSNNLIIYIPNSVPSNNYYINYYIFNETLVQWLDITYYNGTTHLAKLNTSPLTRYFGSWLRTHTYILRKEIPSELKTPLLTTSLSTLYQLTPDSSSVENYYVGSYLRMENGTTESRKIIKYIPTPPPGALAPFNVPNLVVLESPFTTTFNNNYEILNFTRDNEQPFEYPGSLVSHREAVCYDIELLNLVLPNTTLISGYGSRAIFYPFLYVELTPINNSERQGPINIASNNPNSKRMMFRALVFDTTNETNSPFVRIDGSGMVQRIKLLPNDSYKFSVHLPNGELFDTELSEYNSPLPPNNLKQISAMFSLKRVV